MIIEYRSSMRMVIYNKVFNSSKVIFFVTVHIFLSTHNSNEIIIKHFHTLNRVINREHEKTNIKLQY